MPKKISKKRQDKIDKLAYDIADNLDLDSDIADNLDLDSLIEYVRDLMTKSLSSLSKKEFDKEWDDYYGVKKY
jgi:hypothetical protein